MTNEGQHIRPGFHTVTPYLIVAGAARLIEFAVSAFEAEEIRRDLRPDGTIMNAEIRIGDSIVELAEAGEAWPARPGALHVYVRDTDETYQRAIDAGATTLYAPEDMPYGERSAGVIDPAGNHWYIATYQS
jgi:PhnB protein